MILILVSLRAEVFAVRLLGTDSMQRNLQEQLLKQRGNSPTFLEGIIFIYVIGTENTNSLLTPSGSLDSLPLSRLPRLFESHWNTDRKCCRGLKRGRAGQALPEVPRLPLKMLTLHQLWLAGVSKPGIKTRLSYLFIYLASHMPHKHNCFGKHFS